MGVELTEKESRSPPPSSIYAPPNHQKNQRKLFKQTQHGSQRITPQKPRPRIPQKTQKRNRRSSLQCLRRTWHRTTTHRRIRSAFQKRHLPLHSLRRGVVRERPEIRRRLWVASV